MEVVCLEFSLKTYKISRTKYKRSPDHITTSNQIRIIAMILKQFPDQFTTVIEKKCGICQKKLFWTLLLRKCCHLYTPQKNIEVTDLKFYI